MNYVQISTYMYNQLLIIHEGVFTATCTLSLCFQEASNILQLQQEQEQHEKDLERQERMREERARIQAELQAKQKVHIIMNRDLF
jgi:type III secretory pathway component EscU